ncbi:hypothetical protein [Catenuloplanes indicus]|uniref:Uncharacterized protein n=1 Tax=Catenuloplanes indicus TaxID=137267 RepID=A0AAE3W2Y2_9ACTN|nr:hypothetical protein [Catenuloplanes indicus]MDQ0368798.1 hypothetical protein [Catenuloplanes indicus]
MIAALWKAFLMRQSQLFTSAEMAEMRDRTASRNYSAARDEFRRIHERRRYWGSAAAKFRSWSCFAAVEDNAAHGNEAGTALSGINARRGSRRSTKRRKANPATTLCGSGEAGK